MNSQLQRAFQIKQQTHSNNPFVLRLPANSTSQQHIHLSISCHILKKLALVDISQSRQTADLYKQCLLDVIENPLLDLKSQQIMEQLLYFLQYWHQAMGKAASWPHTRTCFYYLEEKLKKAKLFQQLDTVRLKRAHLQPNKKQFLTQIMAQNIHSEKLKQYIAFLKQDHESSSQFSFNNNKNNIKEQHHFASEQSHETKKNENLEINTHKLKNILYSDTHQDWNYFIKAYDSLLSKQRTQQLSDHIDLKSVFVEVIQTYIFQKLPIFINRMKTQNPKQIIIKQLNYKKSIIQKVAPPELLQILNMTISKIKFNNHK